MSLAGFFLRTAFNHLRRGEQRVFAALLCITFGVMSLVAMSLVAHAVGAAVVLTPAEMFGADLSLNRRDEDFIGRAHAAELDALLAAGEASQYTLVAHTSELVYRLPSSGELYFVNTALGIDPAVYPLAGRLVVGLPANATVASLLQAPGDVLITRDLAKASALAVGDVLILSDLAAGTPVTGTVRGILFDTPNHQGSRLYYNVTTAHQLAGHANVLDVALVLTPAAEVVGERLSDTGWLAYPAALIAESNQGTQDMLDLLLKGAGILGLLVGGIGIASTMQVLLRRRQREIAVWKTLGYRGAQLQALFAVEAALLGALGSVLGAGLGVAVSSGLLDLLSLTSNWLLDWSFSPWPVVAGALAGLTTTVLFALWAIVRAAGVAPMALLRGEAVPARGLGWPQTVALALGLAVPFTALTSWIMGSLVEGIGVLLFALAGLVGLGGLLGGLAWVGVRLLGLPPLPLVRLARNNLQRRGLGLVFAMVALFTGVVALAFGVVITQNGQREMAERTVTLTGPEITVLAAASQEAALRAAAQAEGLDSSAYSYQTAVTSITVPAAPNDFYIIPQLIGRTTLGDYTVSGAAWGSVPDGAYTYDYSNLPAGTQVEVTLLDGTTHTLTVVGGYTVNYNGLRPQLGLLLPAELARQIAPPDTVQLDLDAPPAAVPALTRRLGQALPQATVINLIAYTARFIATYRNLFALAVAMSGLALLAGVLLVGNAVSLAMLDRRYEIGVLKAVGYTRGHLITTLLVEYGLVAVIATGAALAAVQLTLWVLGALNEVAGSLLLLEPATAGLIALIGVGLILLTVLLATWGPTRVSPVIVLNDRE